MNTCTVSCPTHLMLPHSSSRFTYVRQVLSDRLERWERYELCKSQNPNSDMPNVLYVFWRDEVARHGGYMLTRLGSHDSWLYRGLGFADSPNTTPNGFRSWDAAWLQAVLPAPGGEQHVPEYYTFLNHFKKHIEEVMLAKPT